MILRRLTQNVKDQNWFAVVLDFIIVVVGVVIGLQVSNWNDARAEKARAAEYSERLMDDLDFEYDYVISLIDYTKATLEAGNQAYLGLAGQVPMDDMTIMIHAFRASQYNWYERRRATFDEMVSAGSFRLIENGQLRDAAFGMFSTPLFDIMREEGGTADYRAYYRETIEPSVAETLRQACGDLQVDTGDRFITLITLDYECDPDISADDLANGVAALRAHPGILDALRLRTAQRAGRVSDMHVTLDTIRLKELLGREDAT